MNNIKQFNISKYYDLIVITLIQFDINPKT